MPNSIDVLFVRRGAASVLLTLGGERDGAAIALPEDAWSHACWLDPDTVLLGRADFGDAVVARIDGERVELVAKVEPPAPWDDLAAIGDRRVLWSHREKGTGCVARIGEDGAMKRGPDLALPRHTHLIGGAAGDVVFAHAARGVAVAGAIDGEGALRLTEERIEIGGFDVAVACGAAVLFVRDGVAQIAALAAGRLDPPRPLDDGDVAARALVPIMERARDATVAVRPPPAAAAPADLPGPVIEVIEDGDAGVAFMVAIDPRSLTVTPDLLGATLALSGFRTVGDPGGPPVVETELCVLLPLEAQVADLRVEVIERVEIVTGPLQAVQRSATSDLPSLEEILAPTEAPRGETSPHLPPDEDLYQRAIEHDRDAPAVRVIAHEAYGPVVIARLALRPVQLTSLETVAVATRLVVSLITAPRRSPWPWERPSDGDTDGPLIADEDNGRDGAIAWFDRGSRNGELLRAQLADVGTSVINLARGRKLARLTVPWEPPGKGHEYLIITDDTQWNAATITAGAAVPGVTGAFRRLIAWKRQRGLRARLVTIGEIVAGKHGDFRTGAFDLQVVLRRFLRWASTTWGTRWLLLGGDASIVPVRIVDVPEYTGGPPMTEQPGAAALDDCRMRWASTYMQIRCGRAAGNAAGIPGPITLVRDDTLAQVPFDAAGTSSPTSVGWFYTTDATFAARSATPTQFLRVNGPAATIRTTYRVDSGRNRIPTDLYYASLANDGNAVAWDADGTRRFIQGSSKQLHAPMAIDLSVGRAPIGGGADAGAFVDKVIAYEQLRGAGGAALDPAWLGRGLLVAENWYNIVGFGAAPAAPAAIPARTFRAGAGLSLLHLDQDYGAGWEFYAYPTPTQFRKLPAGAPPTARCWYYVNSGTDTSPATATIGGLTLPRATRWIAIASTDPTELSPSAYVLNHTDLDPSTTDQEKIRTQAWIPSSRLQQPYTRFYGDLANFPPEVSTSPPQLLGGGGLIVAQLQRHPHFVSLSGHGNPWSCCTVAPTDVPGLPAAMTPAVYFADSCLTAAFDIGGSLGATLVGRAAAGAVGYVGFSREGFIGLGAEHQQKFWSALGTNRRLGALNDTRIAFDSTPVGHLRQARRWQMFVQNLLGDPELYLWPALPDRFQVGYVLGGPWRNLFTVDVRDHANQPVDGVAVHLRAGNQEIFGRTLAGLFRSDLTSLGEGITVTVSLLGRVPSIETVTAGHPRLRENL